MKTTCQPHNRKHTTDASRHHKTDCPSQPLNRDRSQVAAVASRSFPAATACGKARSLGTTVKERVLTVAVEKTGYPADMLDLDLDLEADLGVDTVKQAEMFAAIAGYTTSRAMKTLSCATIPHWRVSFTSCSRSGRSWLQAPVVAKEEARVSAPTAVAEKPHPLRHLRKSRLAMASRNAFSRWSWRRLAIQETCWIWIWISKRSRRRHCQTGGDVRGHPRGI